MHAQLTVLHCQIYCHITRHSTLMIPQLPSFNHRQNIMQKYQFFRVAWEKAGAKIGDGQSSMTEQSLTGGGGCGYAQDSAGQL